MQFNKKNQPIILTKKQKIIKNNKFQNYFILHVHN
jgi:hypothetical protein